MQHQKNSSADSTRDKPPPASSHVFEWSDLTPQIEGRTISALVRQNGISRSDASDLVVDAAMRLVRLGAVARNVPALLVRTAQNIFATRRARDAKARDREMLALEPGHESDATLRVRESAPNENVVDQLAHREELDRWSRRLERAKQTLRASDREILELHYGEEIPLIQIDDMRDHQRGAAKVELHRARERLRKALSQMPSPASER